MAIFHDNIIYPLLRFLIKRNHVERPRPAGRLTCKARQEIFILVALRSSAKKSPTSLSESNALELVLPNNMDSQLLRHEKS